MLAESMRLPRTCSMSWLWPDRRRRRELGMRFEKFVVPACFPQSSASRRVVSLNGFQKRKTFAHWDGPKEYDFFLFSPKNNNRNK